MCLWPVADKPDLMSILLRTASVLRQYTDADELTFELGTVLATARQSDGHRAAARKGQATLRVLACSHKVAFAVA